MLTLFRSTSKSLGSGLKKRGPDGIREKNILKNILKKAEKVKKTACKANPNVLQWSACGLTDEEV